MTTAFVFAALALGLLAVAWLTRTLWWRAQTRSPGLAAVLAVFVGVVAVAGYASLGNLAGVEVAPGQVTAAAPAGSMPSMQQIGEIIDRALKADPKNPRALALAGALAFDKGDYATAVKHWETLAQVEPPDSPAAQQLREHLAEARKRAGMAPAPDTVAKAPPADTPAPKAAPGTGKVSGTVRLAPALKARAAPDDTLFVFARAVDGPRVPVAVLRKQVKDLPLTFTLDDSLAMSPDATLSGALRVVIAARITKGGPVAKAGDLQGQSMPVPVGTSGLTIEINEEVK
jgi:cytochrome c-type biogenesis protein CcmH